MRRATLLWVAALFITLTQTLTGEAVKRALSSEPFNDAVPYVACHTCEIMVHELVQAVEEKRNNASRPTPLREEEIFEYTELVCNPFSNEGAWLRTGNIDVAGGQVTVKFGSTFGQCKRECHTLADACLLTKESETADELTSWLYKKKTLEQITKLACKPVCSKKLSAVKIDPRWGAEVFNPIEDKEMEIERMMDSMQRRREPGVPGVDVFSRDEMTDLQDALHQGDYERFTELDPQASELSEDDFEMLRQMRAAEAEPARDTQEAFSDDIDGSDYEDHTIAATPAEKSSGSSWNPLNWW